MTKAWSRRDVPFFERRLSESGSRTDVRRAQLIAAWRTAISSGLTDSGDGDQHAASPKTESEERIALAERQLAVERERLELSARAGRFGIWDLNIDTNALHCDDGWYRILGRDPSQPLMTLEEFKPFIHPEDVDDATRVDEADVAAMIAEHKDYTNAFRIIRPDGEVRWIISAACLLGGDGAPRRAVGVITDVTERRMAEQSLREEMSALEKTAAELAKARAEAEAAKQARDELLASVSHEIRTPLSGIVCVLHLLERESLSVEARELLREAQACGDMLRALLNDVLDLSKLEAGKLDVASEPVNVVEALAGIVRLLMPQAVQKGIYLREEVDADLAWVVGDPVRIRQCLFNLIGNAIKFTHEGGVRVRIYRKNASRLRIEVHDTGVGLSLLDQQRIFQRFEQVDPNHAARRTIGGAGLGLPITKHLVELMCGEIGFSSRDKVGSTFWVEFDAPHVAAPAETVAAEPASLEQLRILVVDDHPYGREIAVALLEEFGAIVVGAKGGEEAIEIVRGQPFDLILMDMNMPIMNGAEATRRIRALPEFDAASTAIVALTADAMDRGWTARAGAEFDGAILKPFDPAELARTICDVRAAKAAAKTPDDGA